MAARRTNMELNHFDRIIAQRDRFEAERDNLQAKVNDMAKQLGQITLAVTVAEHLPQRDTIAETIRAANTAVQQTAAQTRQETLREVAKAMGAEEAFEAMVSLVGAEKTTPECFAEMLRMCAASSPEEVALQFKAAKVEHPGILFTITEGDPFAGIMDGPEMMPLSDDEGDQ